MLNLLLIYAPLHQIVLVLSEEVLIYGSANIIVAPLQNN